MDKDLALFLRVKYGLAPQEPTDFQLESIITQIIAFQKINGRDPSDSELGTIVRQFCSTAGTYKYGAEVSLALRKALEALRQK